MTRQFIRSPATLLEQEWTFTPTRPRLQIRRLRLQQRWSARRPAPSFEVLRAPTRHERWNLLFLFAPNGELDVHQREILGRVRALQGKLLVICAAPSATDLPDLADADALVWKALNGFDFSAYALGLKLIAEHAPGATVYAQNDSVFGPFSSIDDHVARARWDLTGFIASATVENHISSFAFIIKNVTPARVAALAPVLSTQWCYDDFSPVVVSQETQLARVAHASMTVGAFVYMPVRPAPPSWSQRIGVRLRPKTASHYPLDVSGDPTLGSPLALLDRGFPFLKRSLLGKYAGVVDVADVRAYLARSSWPTDGSAQPGRFITIV